MLLAIATASAATAAVLVITSRSFGTAVRTAAAVVIAALFVFSIKALIC